VTSVAEVKIALEQSLEYLRDSYRSVHEAQRALDAAVDLLTEAGANHPESLVPAGFAAAKERFADQLELMVGSLELVQRLAVEL
jgi:prefoldin subunit 5